MVSLISGTIPAAGKVPPHQPIRALLRAGKNQEAIAELCAILVTRPDDLDAKELLFDAFSYSRNWPPALALAEELVRRAPQEPKFQRDLITTLSNMKRYDEALSRALPFIEKYPDDLTMLDVVKVACFFTGRTDEAIRYGQRALDIRDAEACRNPPPMAVTAPTGRKGRRVISFSLWGPAPFYAYGAMINAVLSRTIYPGWECLFYVDGAVPKACVEFLIASGAKVRRIEDEYPGVGLFQRFLVMNDPTVELFLVRDCDARLSVEEAALVDEWLGSGYPFHAVRDHVLHNELMIGCLWGGRADCGIDIVELMRRYFVHGPTAKYGHDQRMLGLMLWPLIRSRVLVHDKYYRLPGVHTLPLPDPKSHFGAGRQNLDGVLREVDRLGIPRVLS